LNRIGQEKSNEVVAPAIGKGVAACRLFSGCQRSGMFVLPRPGPRRSCGWIGLGGVPHPRPAHPFRWPAAPILPILSFD